MAIFLRGLAVVAAVFLGLLAILFVGRFLWSGAGAAIRFAWDAGPYCVYKVKEFAGVEDLGPPPATPGTKTTATPTTAATPSSRSTSVELAMEARQKREEAERREREARDRQTAAEAERVKENALINNQLYICEDGDELVVNCYSRSSTRPDMGVEFPVTVYTKWATGGRNDVVKIGEALPIPAADNYRYTVYAKKDGAQLQSEVKTVTYQGDGTQKVQLWFD